MLCARFGHGFTHALCHDASADGIMPYLMAGSVRKEHIQSGQAINTKAYKELTQVHMRDSAGITE